MPMHATHRLDVFALCVFNMHRTVSLQIERSLHTMPFFFASLCCVGLHDLGTYND